MSKELPLVEGKLAKSGWCVGNDMTLADVLLWRIAMVLFSFVLGPDQRAALPAFTAWYEKMAKNPAVVKVAGSYHMTAQPWKLLDSNNTITIGAAASAPAATPAAAEDDEMDLFGSDDDDDDQDARMAAKAAQLKAAGQLKEKKAVIAKSMILFEVKPLDSETDLDVLAGKIIEEVVQDGLQWKTEYKKAPVAFGIFKLIIGCTVEDDKVSSDDLVEKIEAFEELVQSVDIAAFNKV